MIPPDFFYSQLEAHGAAFFTGVPDSLLKSFCAYLTDTAGDNRHIIAVNEGAAIALAAGFHLATGKTALVYMQNSGIGNAVNPLLSLTDSAVYRIPLLLLIGWRGEPGVHDEPQHITQGRVTPALIDAMGIPYAVLDDNEAGAASQIDAAFSHINAESSAYALLVRAGTFAPYALQTKTPWDATMSREDAIEAVMLTAGEDAALFSTTGMASRELYELREKHGQGHERDFLTVGSMGHTASIALGFALQRPDMSVFCLDGDGAALMHMGALAAVGALSPRNFCHIVLNNGAHDSVGGQPTIASFTDLAGAARACGYKHIYKVSSQEELRAALTRAKTGPVFIEARVKRGARTDLGRPKSTPLENKAAFMRKAGFGLETTALE